MPTKDYSHTIVEMKLMVDGDDGGEDGLRSPSFGGEILDRSDPGIDDRGSGGATFHE
jgi:hypothetical protein